MLRHGVILCLLICWLSGAARAQDEARALQFIESLQRVLDLENLEPAAQVIAQNPDVAMEAAVVIIGRMQQSTSPEQQAAGALVLNLIARTLDVRKQDTRLSQLLAENGMLLPEETWEGSALARVPSSGPSLSSGNAPPDDLELLKYLLRRADYLTAGELAGQLAKDHPARIARITRYSLAALVGLGTMQQGLTVANQVLPLLSDENDILAVELLATHAAVQSARPQEARAHLQKASALATRAPGAYGQVARFLTKSWAFLFDIQQNPNMPLAEITRRHDAAWAELKTLSPQNRDEFTTEFYILGDAYMDVWVEHLLVAAYQSNQLESVAQLMLSDLNDLLAMAQQMDSANAEAALATMVVLERVVGLLLDSDDPADAREGLAMINKEMPGMHQAVSTEYGEFSSRHAELLRAKKITLDPERSITNYLLGGMHLLNALQLLAENENKALSPGDAQAIERELAETRQVLQKSFTVFLAQETTLAELDYLEKARPAGWQQRAESLIGAFLSEPFLADLRPTQATLLYRRGKLRRQEKRNAEAVVDFQKAIDIFESYIREVGGSQDTAKFIRLFASDLYEEMAKAQLEQGKGQDALETIGRAQQLETAGVFQMNDLRKRVKQEDQVLVTRAQQSKAEIEAQEKTLANLKATRAPSAEIQRASQLLAQSRESYYKTVTDLESRYPAFEKLDIKPINFSKLQRAIPPDTLVVLLFPTDDQLYLLEATSDNLYVRQVAIKKSELDALAKDFRRQVSAFSRNPGPFSWKGAEAAPLKATLSQLYATIVKPIEPEMQTRKAVAFVPYGSLVYLPFGSFLTENPDGGVTFLVEKKQVVVLSKAADLDQIFGPPSSSNGSLVAFGNPDGSLAGATQEVKALAGIFPDSKIYLEGQASPEKLAAVQAPAVSYVHMATHGNLNPQDPRQSYLTMAKGSKLSVSDITGYRLDSAQGDLNLVTLSACQTALGEREGDTDGSDLRSLADAFSFAGCRSMVASLWKVEDNATRDLMVEFYKNLKAGQSKAEALQGAQIALLKNEKYSHPFFWAPFILIGDWR